MEPVHDVSAYKEAAHEERVAAAACVEQLVYSILDTHRLIFERRTHAVRLLNFFVHHEARDVCAVSLDCF
jgi:hypothetical protein